MAKYKTSKDRLGAYAMGGVIKYAGGGETPATTSKKAPTSFDRATMKKKYANNPYLIGGGQNRYNWASMLDREFPLTGGTVREGLYNAARANKIDPALLYGSAMEEGMSGAIDDKNWENASEAYVQWEGKNSKLAEKFPVDSFYNYGLDQFAGNAAAMIKKGYLPKDFNNNFTTFDIENEKGEKGKGSAFNTDANALMAKSAMMHMAQDQLDSYTTKNNVKLTPKQKEFFLLANYNGGEGNMRKMIDSYGKQGYLKDDKFLDASFKPSNYGGIYKNVMARMQVANMLRNEGFLSDFATGGEVDTEDPKKPKPGETPSNSTVNYNSRNIKNNPIDEDALLADRIGEIIGNGYNPYAANGKAIIQGIAQSHGADFAQDLGTRIMLMNQDPQYAKSTPEQKLTALYNSGKQNDKNALNAFLYRAKSIGGSPAAYYQGNATNPTRFAGGGEAGGGMFSASGGGWGMAGQMLPQIGNLLESLFTKPQQQNNQPIVNAQTAKNMTSPYAMGGELDDIDDFQYQEWLQSMFNNQLASEYGLDDQEEKDETLNEGIDEDQVDEDAEDSFAMGGKAKKGIHINPKNKGKFNALKKRTGKSTEELTHSKNPLTRKRAIFAQNAAKWKHAFGGPAYANGGMTDIEVEGDEVVQTPDGQMQDMQGPSHEQGGIPMTVPVGTKIYSDRLQIEGKTMQERKKAREKSMSTAEKTLKKNPHDITARGTYDRTKQVYDMEEQQDMALQKVANKIYSAPQKAAYGDEVGDPWSDYIQTRVMGFNPNVQVPYTPDVINNKYLNADTFKSKPLSTVNTSVSNNLPANVNIPVTAQTGAGFTPSKEQYEAAEEANQTPTYGSINNLTTGDYVGMAGNLFNAIAPIINTKRAARATKPEVNRFQGFGKQALEANAKAQDFAGVNFANAKRDLDTASNSAILRNRLGARSVNTQRALDTVTDINRNKAAGSLYGQYTGQMSTLLGQEAQLANQRDQVVMSGATARDQREAQNTDNYYSNMAQNLVNLGTNVGNIGAQLNKHKANQDNADLLSQLSEYFDFGRDQGGKLVLKNKGKR